jgi:hypothetical protein
MLYLQLSEACTRTTQIRQIECGSYSQGKALSFGDPKTERYLLTDRFEHVLYMWWPV